MRRDPARASNEVMWRGERLQVTSVRPPRGPSPGLYGLGLIIASALCYSMLSIFGKVALAIGLPLLPLLATRVTLRAVILWAWVLLAALSRRAMGRVPRPRSLGMIAWGADRLSCPAA